MDEKTPKLHMPYEYQPSVWHGIYVSSEFLIFLAGIGLASFYGVVVYVIGDWWTRGFRALIAVTIGHLVSGRAAGMMVGYAKELPPWMVLAANMVLETSMVLVFFALFVFSYKQLFVFKPLQRAMSRARRAAVTHHKFVARYGVPGLFFFVWFPFWMTGPVIGCIIGFLMGLRNWVNLTIVLGGTYVATICWGYLLKNLHDRVVAWGRFAPWVLVGVVVLFAVVMRVRGALRKKAAGVDSPAKR